MVSVTLNGGPVDVSSLVLEESLSSGWQYEAVLLGVPGDIQAGSALSMSVAGLSVVATVDTAAWSGRTVALAGRDVVTARMSGLYTDARELHCRTLAEVAAQLAGGASTLCDASAAGDVWVHYAGTAEATNYSILQTCLGALGYAYRVMGNSSMIFRQSDIWSQAAAAIEPISAASISHQVESRYDSIAINKACPIDIDQEVALSSHAQYYAADGSPTRDNVDYSTGVGDLAESTAWRWYEGQVFGFAAKVRNDTELPAIYDIAVTSSAPAIVNCYDGVARGNEPSAVVSWSYSIVRSTSLLEVTAHAQMRQHESTWTGAVPCLRSWVVRNDVPNTGTETVMRTVYRSGHPWVELVVWSDVTEYHRNPTSGAILGVYQQYTETPAYYTAPPAQPYCYWERTWSTSIAMTGDTITGSRHVTAVSPSSDFDPSAIAAAPNIDAVIEWGQRQPETIAGGADSVAPPAAVRAASVAVSNTQTHTSTVEAVTECAAIDISGHRPTDAHGGSTTVRVIGVSADAAPAGYTPSFSYSTPGDRQLSLTGCVWPTRDVAVALSNWLLWHGNRGCHVLSLTMPLGVNWRVGAVVAYSGHRWQISSARHTLWASQAETVLQCDYID